MNLILLSPRNDLSGNRKLVTMFARELGTRHAVRILYPIVPDRAFTAHQRRPRSRLGVVKTVLGDVGRYVRHPSWRHGAALNGSRVTVQAYWHAIPRRVVESVDALVYFTPYQAMELSEVPRGREARVFYVMHDQTRTDGHVVDPELIRQTYGRADHLIALSEETRRHLAELGVACEGIVPAGVDTACFHPNDSAHSGPPSLLGYYWPGEPRKGASVLLSALEQVRSRHPEIPIGLLTSNGVRASGYPTYSNLTEQELAGLYRRYAIFIYPSSAGEGFALPPLEAMASGCGVVGTRVGAVGEYARHEVSALLCDPGSAEQLTAQIERFLRHPDVLSTIRRHAVADAQAWSWRHAAERLEQYLNTIVGHH